MDSGKKIALSGFAIAVLAIVALLLLALLCVRYYLNDVLYDGRMAFPSEPVGVFVEQPRLVAYGANGEPNSVAWVLPQSCRYNSYEVVTVDYRDDEYTWSAWFGSDEVECSGADGTDGAVTCTVAVSDEIRSWLKRGMDLWFVAKGGICRNGVATVVSERLTISAAVE